jgi:hypothetical protein
MEGIAIVEDNYGELTKMLQDIGREIRREPNKTGYQEEFANNILMMSFDDVSAFSLQSTVEVLGLLSDKSLATRFHDEQAKLSKNFNTFTLLPDKSRDLGIEFIQRVLRNIRDVICSKSNLAGKSKGSMDIKQIATSIATAAAASVGISNPMILGMTVMVLLVVSRASHKAFCEMTEVELVESIKEKSKDKKVKLARRQKAQKA